MPAPGLMYGRKHQKGYNVLTTVAMSAFHVGAVAAFFFIDAGAIAAAVVLYCLAGMFGIGIGYYRLLTHRGYKWYELDPNWMGIRTLQALGLAWDIKLPRSGATSLSGGLRPPDPLARSLAGAPDAPLRSRGFARCARSRMRR